MGYVNSLEGRGLFLVPGVPKAKSELSPEGCRSFFTKANRAQDDFGSSRFYQRDPTIKKTGGDEKMHEGLNKNVSPSL